MLAAAPAAALGPGAPPPRSAGEQGGAPRPAAPPPGVGRSSALPLRRWPVRGGELQETARVLAGGGRRGGGGAGEGPEQGGAAHVSERESDRELLARHGAPRRRGDPRAEDEGERDER